MKYFDKDAARKLCEAATPGPGDINHTPHISTPGLKEQILDALSTAIDKTIAHDGGHSWWWIETAGGLNVAHFGCGPDSEANAKFFGIGRGLFPKALDRIEELEKALYKANLRFMAMGNATLTEGLPSKEEMISMCEESALACQKVLK